MKNRNKKLALAQIIVWLKPIKLIIIIDPALKDGAIKIAYLTKWHYPEEMQKVKLIILMPGVKQAVQNIFIIFG